MFDAYGKIMVDFIESYKDEYGGRDHNDPPDELKRLVSAALTAAYAAGVEASAQVAEQPLGMGLGGRDDYWQPRIAAAIRSLTAAAQPPHTTGIRSDD